MSEPTPGRLYSAVTKYWPRIAAALAAAAALGEFVVGGLTANGVLQFYVFAWASATGGLWFMFDKAEQALGEETRQRVAAWLLQTHFESAIRSIPSQFTLLFDRVFGDRHFSLRCFARSCVATAITVVLTMGCILGAVLLLSPDDGVTVQSFLRNVAISTPLAISLNVLPDYLSLLETRWMLGRAAQRGRLGFALVADTIITLVIAASVGQASISSGLTFTLGGFATPAASFLSTFFTSVWLWLYAVSVVVSRFLVRMGGGVGFLLKVTDLERQPLRSMGFVSVILVSGAFLLGLPLFLR